MEYRSRGHILQRSSLEIVEEPQQEGLFYNPLARKPRRAYAFTSSTDFFMVHIKIKKGLDIPLEGAPSGKVQQLPLSGEVALDFTPFSSVQPRLLVQVGDSVAIGQPLVEDKRLSGRHWVSPGSGKVKEILRGEKRALNGIVISCDGENRQSSHPSVDLKAVTKDQLIHYLMQTGLLSYFSMRPFCLPAHPLLRPRSLFVKALESAPFTPPAEMQIEGQEECFQAGLRALSGLVEGALHLVCRKGSLFEKMEGAIIHTAEGPHPISHPSLHIQKIDPIRKSNEVVWTVDALGVLAVGKMISENRFLHERVVALAGTGFSPQERGYYRMPLGCSLQFFSRPSTRLLSGDPLMGEVRPFLGFFHSVCTALEEDGKREAFHFFRFGRKKYTATRAYASAFLGPKQFSLTTRLHGEERAFIDPNIYDRVMPLAVPTVPFVKALLCEDYERAETLGLLEVAPEDFALPTFICPSKIEMVEIVEKGLKQCAAEILAL